MAGGLFDPIEPRRMRQTEGRTIPRLLLWSGLGLAAVAALVAISIVRDDGSRGEPRVISPIVHVPTPAATLVPPVGPPTAAAPVPAAVPAAPLSFATDPTIDASAPPGTVRSVVRGDEDVEIQNGVRIVRPRSGMSAPSQQTLIVPPSTGDTGAARQAGRAKP